MASELTNFFIKLTSVFDGTGLKAADDAIAKTTKKATGLDAALASMAKAFVAGASIYKIIGFAKESFIAFSEAEKAAVKLNQALKTNGVYSDVLSQKLQKFAAHIQSVTTIEDDTVIQTLQLALSMGISANKLEEATQQAIGLSKAFGVELNAAMKMVALAGQGDYTMLQKYVPQLRDLKDESKKAALAQNILTASFAQATTETNTSYGAIQQLINTFGDFKEKIGELISIPLTPWIKNANTILEWLNERFNLSGDKVAKLKKEILELSEQLGAINKQGVAISGTDVLTYKDAERIRTAIDVKLAELKALRAMGTGAGSPAATMPSASVEAAAFPTGKLELYKTPLEEYKSYLDEKARLHEETENKSFEITQYFATLEMEKRKAAIASAWDNIISLANSSNATLSAIGKAGAIVRSTINAHETATKAMADLPFPFNIVASAASYAAAMAHVAEISGMALATGGMALPVPGGTLARIGEAGKAEAVIPLDDSRTTKKLRENLVTESGGTNVTLNNTFNFGAISSALDVKRIATELSEATRRGVAWAVENAKISYKIGQRYIGDTAL